MMDLLTDIIVITGLGLMASALLVAARTRFAPETTSTVDLINAELPQTQCAQCGYPGCRPYAQAISEGESINRCPPGGDSTINNLASLLGRPIEPLDENCGEAGPPLMARIIEAECIGCTLCIAACPVDAIIGAPQQMHTVIESLCTGCDLCREPCPVDCIEMFECEPVMELPVFPDQAQACINCGNCHPACPKDLQPQLLYWHRYDPTRAEEQRLDDCVECGRCDAVCPSELPLTNTFRATKLLAQQALTARELALETEQRYLKREHRLIASTSRVVQRPSKSERDNMLDKLRMKS
jgi:electron transport complex protein RnfB